MITRRRLQILAKIILWLATVQSAPSKESEPFEAVLQDACDNGHDNLLCGSDYVTYLNLCEFQKALDRDPHIKIVENGPCLCDPSERHEWDPVCASDSQSYANNCEVLEARQYQNITIRNLGLCNAMMKRKTITYRELQKVKSWHRIMPKELFESLSSRDLAEGEGHESKKKNKKRNKHKKDKSQSHTGHGNDDRKPDNQKLDKNISKLAGSHDHTDSNSEEKLKKDKSKITDGHNHNDGNSEKKHKHNINKKDKSNSSSDNGHKTTIPNTKLMQTVKQKGSRFGKLNDRVRHRWG